MNKEIQKLSLHIHIATGTKMKPQRKRKRIDMGDKKTSKKAKMSAQHDAAKQIFKSKEIKTLTRRNRAA